MSAVHRRNSDNVPTSHFGTAQSNRNYAANLVASAAKTALGLRIYGGWGSGPAPGRGLLCLLWMRLLVGMMEELALVARRTGMAGPIRSRTWSGHGGGAMWVASLSALPKGTRSKVQSGSLCRREMRKVSVLEWS